MSDLEFRKKLLINEFKTMSKGKTNEEILPLLLAVNNKAKQAGIVFTQEDFNIILAELQKDMTPQELKILPQLLMLLSGQAN